MYHNRHTVTAVSYLNCIGQQRVKSVKHGKDQTIFVNRSWISGKACEKNVEFTLERFVRFAGERKTNG